jgi:beta-1,4-mannosyl-glycoprotein beta-1,4-N-acetylglucosaminyltransferase
LGKFISNQGMKNIIDTFLFFNELDLLKARLEYLGPHIKNFFIVEANIDFSGKEKPFNLQSEISHLPYAEKIVYYPLCLDLNNAYWTFKKIRYFRKRSRFLWKIQDAQRNSILEAIRSIKSEECDFNYVLFGDLDEFPNVNFLQSLNAGTIECSTPKTLRQRLFYYQTDIVEKKEAWFGTICSPYTEFLQKKPKEWRSLRERLPYIEHGGFHFSYFMPPEKIKDKLNAILEVENLKVYLDMSITQIQETILSNQDLFGRDLGLVKQTGQIPEDLYHILLRNMNYLKNE